MNVYTLTFPQCVSRAFFP